jgi:hypothetical protein
MKTGAAGAGRRNGWAEIDIGRDRACKLDQGSGVVSS